MIPKYFIQLKIWKFDTAVLTNSAQATWNRQILLEFQRTQFFIGIGGSSRFYIFLGRFTDLILFGQIVRIKLLPFKIYSPLIWFQCSRNIILLLSLSSSISLSSFTAIVESCLAKSPWQHAFQTRQFEMCPQMTERNDSNEY